MKALSVQDMYMEKVKKENGKVKNKSYQTESQLFNILTRFNYDVIIYKFYYWNNDHRVEYEIDYGLTKQDLLLNKLGFVKYMSLIKNNLKRKIEKFIDEVGNYNDDNKYINIDNINKMSYFILIKGDSVTRILY